MKLTPEAIKKLQEVKQHILEEPNRLSMDVWCTRKEDDEVSFLGDGVLDPSDRHEGPIYPQIPFAACGTAGCIAGWVVLLTDGLMADPFHYPSRACEILGLSSVGPTKSYLDIFYPWKWENITGCYSRAHEYNTTADQGKRAAIVGYVIDKFIEEYQ